MEHVSAETIEIAVNGEPREAPAGATVDLYLRGLALDPDLVVVELNGEILPRKAFGTTVIDAGDEIEVVHFVGGG